MLLKIKNINKSYNDSHAEESVIFENLNFILKKKISSLFMVPQVLAKLLF